MYSSSSGDNGTKLKMSKGSVMPEVADLKVNFSWTIWSISHHL
jgi:hypothetical protein